MVGAVVLARAMRPGDKADALLYSVVRDLMEAGPAVHAEPALAARLRV